MLQIHRAERAAELLTQLGDLLSAPPDDPFVPEVVAVESLGTQRWLSQSLAMRLGASAGGDGVCANVSFPRPSRLAADLVATASGVPPEDDPWSPARLPWHVLQVIDRSGDQEWLRPVALHVGLTGDG